MLTYIYTFRPLRDRFLETMDSQERAAFQAHFGYTEALAKDGRLVLKGATTDGSLGVVVFEASGMEEATAIFSGDPATRLSSLDCQCQPFTIVKMRPTLDGKSGTIMVDASP